MEAPSCVYGKVLNNLKYNINAQAQSQKVVAQSTPLLASVHEGSLRKKFLQGATPTIGIPAAAEGGIKLFSPAYYAACTVGGILSCGLTHTMVTPLDVVKCNMQV